jgi:hypothetical protein
MSLKIRFRFDGRCSVHPRYNPEQDGRPQHRDCSGCESLWVVHLYCGIARRKALTGEGILVARPAIHADKGGPDVTGEADATRATEEQRATPERDETGELS